MLIPMLCIYQEYVRNHHYSVQVLTECKQSAAFSVILDKLENKPACHSCQLDTFLLTPMHQVRYNRTRNKFRGLSCIVIL